MMFTLGPLGFTAPWLLLGLIALPILWLLLRAIPPAPIRRRFPAVALLLGLSDERLESERTPWWLLLLRCLAVAAAILAFAGPVLNPARQATGSGPLLILTDGSWASARDWPARLDRIEQALTEAGRAGRRVALVSLSDPPKGDALPFQSAESWRARLAGLSPEPWAPQDKAVAAWAGALSGRFQTLWLSDGLDRASRAPLLAALESHGTVRVFQTAQPVMALRPARFEGGKILLTAIRAATGPAQAVTITAYGPDPAGTERDLASLPASFKPGAQTAEVTFTLPPELRNRITRFAIANIRSAGAVSLTDDTLKRRKVALIAGDPPSEQLQLLSPLHYLREALTPNADILTGTFGDLLQADPDVVILADVAKLPPEQETALEDWVKKGGLLLRFAGPHVAAMSETGDAADPLMPVRLRYGGRELGGALSWGEPKHLAPFAKDSPFFGLEIPPDVTVREQVVAQPDPDLAARTIASLADGTPLVTRKGLGQGQVVLFHVTANAEWSSLPLSGLFVEMLDRLAVAGRAKPPTAAELKGVTWAPARLIDAFGLAHDAGEQAGISGEALAAGLAGPATPPGLYAADARRVALNVTGPETRLAPASWPARIAVEGQQTARERALKGPLLGLGLLLLLADVFAALALGGRLRGAAVRRGGTIVVLGLALLLGLPGAGRAQDTTGALPGDSASDFALRATQSVVLAHVLTGDASVDQIAQEGLQGLSNELTARTSVEPATPIGVDLEKDDLSLFPFLYWPITADEPLPSNAAYAKLNNFLRTGGMILFDTRDGDVAGYGQETPQGQRLKAIAAGLDIPALAPIPADHVLTRSFYLLQDFPGRYDNHSLWVEAPPADAARAEGMPFRNLNDNVSPVVIGGNDWAAAWAVDSTGTPLFPVGRGATGERQREIAYRFGINLIMYVLTGNYKSDQVHVPALLERLGQ